jgi:hypothetical protein
MRLKVGGRWTESGDAMIEEWECQKMSDKHEKASAKRRPSASKAILVAQISDGEQQKAMSWL